MDLKKLFAAGATALALATGTAQAATITGSIAFSDGLSTFNNTTSIVSQLNAIDDDIATPETASSCTGAFVCPPGTTGNFAFDFTLGVPDQLIYTYAGYTFQVQAFGPIVRTALSCFANGCGDSLDFFASGVVFGNGITPTQFTMNFGAEGVCDQLDSQTACVPESATASWSSQVVVSGRPGLIVPEPHTAVLLVIGLIALALVRRRRA